ncbi:MAG: ROK family transcriptional regulator [Spirochaetales bacterium]|nr:ROK family transcriptional regulator [Spirochaetales bacterium]
MDFSHPSVARTVNRLRVLNLIALEGAISRAEIARTLDLSKPSTSEIVALLLEENLVTESGKAETASGRRPTNLKLKADGALVLGIDMDIRTTTYTVANIHGAILRMEKFPIREHPDPKTAGAEIIKRILKLTHESKIPFKAIVLTTSGTFSADRKTLVAHTYWSWEEIPLAEVIEKNTAIPTIFAETTRSMSFAERWFHKETPPSYLYINWGEHLESALYVNSVDRLSRFEHTPVSRTGLCFCGQIGCLETVAGLSRIGKEEIPQAARAIGQALIAADRATAVDAIIIAGPQAREHLPIIRESFQGSTPIIPSILKERSTPLASVAVALDWGIFGRSMLEQTKTATRNG